MSKWREPWSRRTRALFRAIERDNVIGSGAVDRIKASGRVRSRQQAGHMTAPSRIEINQIALDPCGPSTHDNTLAGHVLERTQHGHFFGMSRGWHAQIGV